MPDYSVFKSAIIRSTQLAHPSCERHGKTKRNYRDKDRQNPLGRVVSGHDCRAYPDDEPGNYCIAERDAIDLPFF